MWRLLCPPGTPGGGWGGVHTHREIHCCVWERPLWRSVVPNGEFEKEEAASRSLII